MQKSKFRVICPLIGGLPQHWLVDQNYEPVTQLQLFIRQARKTTSMLLQTMLLFLVIHLLGWSVHDDRSSRIYFLDDF